MLFREKYPDIIHFASRFEILLRASYARYYCPFTDFVFGGCTIRSHKSTEIKRHRSPSKGMWKGCSIIPSGTPHLLRICPLPSCDRLRQSAYSNLLCPVNMVMKAVDSRPCLLFASVETRTFPVDSLIFASRSPSVTYPIAVDVARK